MATPLTNDVPTTVVEPTGSSLIDSLLGGTKWGSVATASPVLLTWSVPSGTAWFEEGYEEYKSWYSLTPPEVAGVNEALKCWSSVSGVSFVKTFDNETTVGELRFALSDYVDAYANAHAYLPSTSPSSGDVWFSAKNWHASQYSDVTPGSYDFLTILHEIGHALGLTHSFETGLGGSILPKQLDNYFYSIMSYTTNPWLADAGADFYPTTPMYYDLLAIQALYGRNENANKGSNVYRFNEWDKYWETIDDFSGTDTIIYTGTTGCEINLREGSFSRVGKPIEFYTGGVSKYSAKTVCIGPGTVIERATGGLGNDWLLGNEINNILAGRNGNDKLFGYGGNDRLVGGVGNDSITGGAGNDVLTGGRGKDALHGGSESDIFDFDSLLDSVVGSNRDLIRDFATGVDKIDLRTIDANSLVGGNQAFKWIGGKSFSGHAGEVRFALGILRGDTDGDRVADFEIKVVGKVHVGDLLL